MSSRFALWSGLSLCAIAGALFFWRASAGLVALAFLLGGWLGARLAASRDETAAPSSEAGTETHDPARAVGERRDSNGLSHSSTGLQRSQPVEPEGVSSPEMARLLLGAMMESLREGVVVVDDALRVLALNGAAREIFGGAEESLRSRRLTELTRSASVHGAFQAALADGRRADVKVEMQDAERRVFELSVAPLALGRDGRERAAIGVFFNITRLERLERVRQEFLSNVSHELRTPLTAIITFVESLDEGALEDATHNRRFLSIIRRNAERMSNLLEDILELSAIEAGRVTVEPKEVRLRGLVGEVFTALSARAVEARVELRNEIAEGVIVHADARRLEQMLTNLVDNAVKFNREGGSVAVSHERTARSDRIHIADTGEGIPAEHLPRIFERFYRVDRARSRALGGTGLGLAIVKHLARAHAGEASVRSAHDSGTTFTIELPHK